MAKIKRTEKIERERVVQPGIDLISPSVAAAILGRLGGQATSAAKADASRRNGRLGGRPRKS